MSFWKARADRQDRYRRELYTGVIVACHADGSYDVTLPGVAEPVRRVPNSGDVQFQTGNRVVLQRLADRSTWQIQLPVTGAAPARYTDPGAMVNPPPLVYWGGLARSAAEADTVAAYVDGKRWPLAALLPSGAGEGQVPQWSTAAGAWVPATVAGEGTSPEALRLSAAAALAGLIGQATRPLVIPTGVGGWLMDRVDDTDPALSRGAHVYTAAYQQDVRAGAYPVTPSTLAYWKMDEVALNDLVIDCSGNGRHATPIMLTAGGSGQFHRARRFDGLAGYAFGPAVPMENVNSLSLEVWVKPGSVADLRMLLHQSNTTSMSLRDAGTLLRCYLLTNGTSGYADAPLNPAVLTDGNWHYLAAVYTGTQLQLYVDGQPAGNPAAVSGTLRPCDGSGCYLGVYVPNWGGTSYFYDGYMEEFRISREALTAGQIAETWAARTVRAAVMRPHTFPMPCRTVMLGAVATLNGGTASYAVSPDAGATWLPIDPWEWQSVAAPAPTWHVRATLTGAAEVKRLGLLGMP